MNFLKRLFTHRSNAAKMPSNDPVFDPLYRKVLQVKADQEEHYRQQDEYWAHKQAELQSRREAEASSSSTGPASDNDQNAQRAADLAKIAEWHFKCARFEEARKNYERAAMLTAHDTQLSRQYREQAEKASRRTG